VCKNGFTGYVRSDVNYFTMLSDYTLLNGRMIKDELEKSGCGQLKVLSKNLLVGTEQNHKNLNQDSWCPS
jgi:hypothetical protein